METVPKQPRRFPVRRLTIEVVSGPDTGLVREATEESITVGTARGNDIVLSDPTVSRYHLTCKAVSKSLVVTDHGSTNGTRIGPVTLRDGAVEVAIGSTVAVGQTELMVKDGGVGMVDLHPTAGYAGLVGSSTPMRHLLAKVERAADADAPVLILGESGTGKELIARALHQNGPRRDEALVTLDGAAMTPSLYSSELFGHERGAFTGAAQRHIGAFERAHRGTLFIDEVGELDEPMQSALLGAIERGVVRRVGGRDDIAIDLRLVCATHRDLRARVNDERFRLDLYYRLAVVVLEVPPLRDRREDLELLIESFMHRAGHDGSATDLFTTEQLSQMRLHSWPGNVRELRNVVLRTLALGRGPELELERAGSPAPADFAALHGRPFKEARRSVLDRFETQYLQQLLERNGGNLRKSAREAGIDRSYLTELLRRHGLKD